MKRKWKAFVAVSSLFLVSGMLLSCQKRNGNPPVSPSSSATPTMSSEGDVFKITIANPLHGSLKSDKTSVKKGESVTFALKADEHYEFSKLTINSSEITALDNGKYVYSNVQSDLVVSAEFLGKKVTVHFDTDGQGEIADKVYRYHDVFGELPIPESAPTGHVFDAWYTAKTEGTKIESDMLVEQDIPFTIYANYRAAEYTIILDPNGGEANPASLSVHYGDAVGELPTPTLSGKIFLGWFDASGTEISRETIYNVAGDSTLTARWGELSVSGYQKELLTYPGDEASDSMTLSFAGEGIDLSKISVSSDNANVAVEGTTVSSESATIGETASLVISYRGVEVETLPLIIKNYKAAGYVAVSSVSDLASWDGTKNAVVTVDIDMDGAALAADGVNRNQTAIFDGDGHSISNGVIRNGWNGSLSTWLRTGGAIRDVAFLKTLGPTANSFSSGLVSIFEGGVIENAVLQYTFRTAAGDGDYQQGGSLLGVLSGSAESNAKIHNVLIVADGANGYANNGLLAGRINTSSENAKVENVAIVSSLSSPTFAVKADSAYGEYEKLARYSTTKAFLDGCAFRNEIHPNLRYEDEMVKWLSTTLLEATPEYQIVFAESSLQMHANDEAAYLSFTAYHYGEETDGSSATFRVEDTAVATIDDEGLITPVASGQTNIVVTFQGKEYKLPLTISEALYHITTFEELKNIGQHLDGDFVLDNDIDCAGAGFWNSDYSPIVGTFTGTIDGQGHAIKNLWLPSGWNNGFVKTLNGGTIKNIAFINIYGPASNYNNGLIGIMNGGAVVDNCYLDYVLEVDDTDTGSDYSGTLAGAIYDATISNCLINIRSGLSGDHTFTKTGSLVGMAGAWASKVSACFSLSNGLSLSASKTYVKEAADGVGSYAMQNGSADYADYASFKANAPVSSFSSLWEFGDSYVNFGGQRVLG